MTNQREGTCRELLHVLIIEDTPTANRIRHILEEHGYEFSPIASDGDSLLVPEGSEAFRTITDLAPEATVMTVQAAKQQADKVPPTSHPVSEERTETSSELHTREELKGNYANIIGDSPPVFAMLQEVDDFAYTDAHVLILGETGTGKELVAQAIHRNGARSEKRMLTVNCAAISPHLILTELFGYEKGAFTGADKQQIGLFEAAKASTLFLDEIGELSLELQAVLLRVLEERTIRRVGGVTEIPVDVRVIAATNRDLPKEVAAGKFREDLYERLKTLSISTPSLRERKEDIPALAQHFLDIESMHNRQPVGKITEAAYSCLQAYTWPRNIRQLKDTILSTMLRAKGSDILPKHLPEEVQQPLAPQFSSPEEAAKRQEVYVIDFSLRRTWAETIASVERACLLQALARTNENRTHAAQALGLELRTFYRKLRRHHISRMH